MRVKGGKKLRNKITVAAETGQNGGSKVEDDKPYKFRAQGARGWNGRKLLRGRTKFGSDGSEATSTAMDMDSNQGENLM
jgi:hypothetical protein